MESKYTDNARVFKAFCDENRLMILEMLQNGEKCACVLLEKMNIVQSTLSHHMKILVDSGIVSARKDGKWTYYSISGEGVAFAKELLIKLTAVIENCDCLKCECADNPQSN
ncbi:MAG: metalloregulator ArsR/SmtB family transcription factor [Oscillospiraceae bacterium]|nr:metalloregulator ArsR/SmtB family transcription factor [Oscillospiraceae bacterium]